MARTTKAATITAAIAIVVALLAYPGLLAAASANPSSNLQPSGAASAVTSPTTTSQLGQQVQERLAHSGTSPNFGGGWRFRHQIPVNLSVGQTITITSTQGEYWVFGTPSQNGTASGVLTFTVTSKLAQGYTLSITGGSFVVDGTTYTLSSGSAQMGRFANTMAGQGTTTHEGHFLLRAAARGSFAGTSGSVSLDFTNGTTEYLVILAGTVQG